MIIPVDLSRFADQVQFLSVSPVEVFEDGHRVEGMQAANSDGVPLWAVQALVLRQGRRPQLLKVKVPSDKPFGIPPTRPVVFDGLTAVTWERNGRSGVSFNASGIAEA